MNSLWSYPYLLTAVLQAVRNIPLMNISAFSIRENPLIQNVVLKLYFLDLCKKIIDLRRHRICPHTLVLHFTDAVGLRLNIVLLTAGD